MPRKRPGLGDIADQIAQIGRGDSQVTGEPVQSPATDRPAERAEARPVSAAQPAPPAADEPDDVERTGGAGGPYWHKATALYRREQLDRLEDLLARWAADRRIRVRVSTSELMRLALDEILARGEAHPDEVLLALHRQAERELSEVPSRKFGRSRGVKEYLKRRGKL